MNAWIDTIAGQLERSVYPGALVQVFLESLMVLALAGAVCVIWRRAAAAAKHLIWFLAMVSLPLLLGVSLLPFSGQKPVWSVSTGFDSGNKFLLGLRFEPASTAAEPAAANLQEQEQRGSGIPPTSSEHPAFALRVSSVWLVLGAFLWTAGALLGGLWMLVGQGQLRRLSRNATPLDTPGWEDLLQEVCEKLRLRRVPVLLESSEELMPLTWGWWRPRVILPAEAANWPSEKRRVVLLHELAHVKRRDCLTQTIARVIGALFWVNPLVWVASRRMCVERERACDDLVLAGGCRASEYAGQLLEIARSFRCVPFAAGIAMARSTQIQGRIAAIIDGSRRRRPHWAAGVAALALMGALAGGLAATSGRVSADATNSVALRRQQTDQLESFARAKEQQSEALAAKAGETITPEFEQFFKAALRGDFQTVTNRYEFFKRHHPQYSGTNAINGLRTAYWSPVLEICLAYDHVANCEPKYTKILVDGIINSIPPGSIYLGGTDPGRGVPTAFEKSSIQGEPFFVVTQNALADATYLEYLRAMYGGKIYTPSGEDSQKCFQEYLTDATRRLDEHKLKPGEDVRKTDNRIEVSGQVAVMAINGLLTKVIFDRNPDREFYIEESFPLDWMYPYLEPHGLIMKINREPLARLPEDMLAKDRQYWGGLVTKMLGSSLEDQARISDLAAFVERVYVRRDLKGFAGDPLYIQNDYSKRIYSKLRSSIAGVYAWRLGQNTPTEALQRFKERTQDITLQPKTESDRARLLQETDLAFRQAFALCPYSPEAIFRYVSFLLQFNRVEDARLIAQTGLDADPKNKTVQELLRNVEQMKGR